MMVLSGEIWPIFILFILLVAGVLMCVRAYDMYVGNSKKCKVPVVAKCVELRASMSSEGRMLTCPVYEVNYEGKKLTLCDNVYTTNNGVAVGDERVIYINPDMPNLFYDDNESKVFAYALGGMGIIFVGISLLSIGIMAFA